MRCLFRGKAAILNDAYKIGSCSRSSSGVYFRINSLLLLAVSGYFQLGDCSVVPPHCVPVCNNNQDQQWDAGWRSK